MTMMVAEELLSSAAGGGSSLCSQLLLLRLFNASVNATLFYMLRRSPDRSQVVRLLPDHETISFLGFNVPSAQEVSLPQFRNYSRGPPIESVHMSYITPDAVIHREVIRMEALQGPPLFDSMRVFEPAWNPSIERFGPQGRFVMTERVSVNQATLVIEWLNASADGRDAGPPLHPGPIPVDPGNKLASPGDARLLALDNTTLLMTFCATPGKFQATRVGALYLRLDENLTSPGQAGLEQQEAYLMRFDPPWESRSAAESRYQKNWAPFVYNDTVYYVESFDPLTVVTASPPAASNATEEGVSTRDTVVVSRTWAHGHWAEWGDMRGGTAGKRIGNNSLLFFFHSRKFLDNNARTTYFFGAVITTAQPPFTMKFIRCLDLFSRIVLSAFPQSEM